MEELTSTAEPKLANHWKWLVGVLGGGLIALQAFGWIEARISMRVEERVRTATAIAQLENYGKESKTWMDGRVNTLSAEVDGLRRELNTLRLDLRAASTAAAAAPAPRPIETVPAPVR